MTKFKNIYMDDYTPYAVCRQGMEWATRQNRTRRFLDPSTGSGVFGRVVRELTPGAVTVGVEPDPLEQWWARHNYDLHFWGRFEDDQVEGRFDLIATNPPFHSWEDFVQRSVKKLQPKGIAMFLGLTSWGSRSRSGILTFKECPPAHQLRIAGTVAFRGSSACDTRDYCWWVFREGHNSPSWSAETLPRLDSQQRKWKGKVKPGRETDEAGASTRKHRTRGICSTS